MNGGYDVNVRQLAAHGVRVIGRVIAASGATPAVQDNANQVLAEADEAYTSFLSTARQFVSNNGIDDQLDPDEREEPIPLPGVEEADSLNLARKGIKTVIWATGHAYDFNWMIGIPVFDGHGRPDQQRGVTPVRGLYFLGLHRMHTFKSGLSQA
ncbi:hypothetical protein QFZ65_001296 [Arthrobacter sp. B3I9]|nr:hypothetical protein [Arthrobacter sp. B3I9]